MIYSIEGGVLAIIIIAIIIALLVIGGITVGIIFAVKGVKKGVSATKQTIKNANADENENKEDVEKDPVFKDVDGDGKVGFKDVGATLAKTAGYLKGNFDGAREKAHNEAITVYCSHCGAKNTVNDKYCSSCGAPMNNNN